MSAAEIKLRFVWKFVYRAQEKRVDDPICEAMQDFEANDEIRQGGSRSSFADGARRTSWSLSGQTTYHFRETLCWIHSPL